MEHEILPIGSICTLKNDDKKILIVGLYSVVYDQDIIVYDYQGCSYPEGLTLSDKIYSFNHADIDKVIHRGYEDQEFKNLRHRLMNEEIEENTEEYIEETVEEVAPVEVTPKYINNIQPEVTEEVEENKNSDIEILVLE